MGLTTWKNSPDGPIRKQDVSVAKNYLNKEELDALNRIVSMYLDYAEGQASKRQAMYMADWVKKLDGFLQFNEKNILTHAGKVSHRMAQEHAEKEFEKLETERRQLESVNPVSDFDRLIEKLPISSKKNTKDRG